jgi:FPC/CPF motif-containing protein YcgG
MQQQNYNITKEIFMKKKHQAIIRQYLNLLNNKDFPCIIAKAALANQHVRCMIADHMASPEDDPAILAFLYNFVDEYRKSDDRFYSAIIIFQEPTMLTETSFDELLWKRLQALADLDALDYRYDKRVSADPSSESFSFSIKEEAFYVIGLHPFSSRRARQFDYPALVFNPHAQFEKLRETNKYQILKDVVRKRDIAYSGSVNPMLEDFGKTSEVFQYSGRVYNDQWKCPLNLRHGKNEDDTTA